MVIKTDYILPLLVILQTQHRFMSSLIMYLNQKRTGLPFKEFLDSLMKRFRIVVMRKSLNF